MSADSSFRQRLAALDQGLQEEGCVNLSQQPAFSHLLAARISRRNLLRAGSSLAVLGAASTLAGCSTDEVGDRPAGPFGFVEVGWESDENLRIPQGYQADVLLRWGDGLFASSPAFQPHRASAAAQRLQFGYNCDYTAFLPITPGGNDSLHGILAVNHEFTLSPLMHPNSPFPDELSAEQLLADIAAHGMSLVEVVRDADGWHYRRSSPLNRRITPHTPMVFDGPAAGHPRLAASGGNGIRTQGTWNNCAGGVTPWGTVLTAEENINLYFDGDPAAGPEAENHRRFGLDGTAWFGWHLAESRWRLNLKPSYPLHGGWIVEIDPYDPHSTPVKHTALGRMKHEGCTVVLNEDDRIVCYMGDDQSFEYLYRYVSRGRYSGDKASNSRLLSDGELSVARFNDGGGLIWVPLVFGREPLTPDNGFDNQGDVVLDVRRAADLLKATPMDRPEGISVREDRIYCAMTAGSSRASSQPGSPRAPNPYGHILELTAPGGDHTAERYQWEVFLLAGRNSREAVSLHPHSGEGSYFINPDNLSTDPDGHLWIATDGATDLGLADTLLVCGLAGSKRRLPSRFLAAPTGAEVTGPSFTPDGETLFCSIQHPGWALDASFEKPSTRWPDFHPKTPPRPSVVAVTRKGGGSLLD